MKKDLMLSIIQKRWIMLCLFVMMCVFGYYSWTQLSIEAYPDIADVTSQVVTQVPGLAAEEVEQQITIPLERAINGLPGMHVMRSKSTFGLSMITIVFKDGTEDYWSRQRVQERLNEVELPYGAAPGLDPLTSPVGEVYRYIIESDQHSLRELTDLQNWVVIPRIKEVSGVADVTNFGGITTQFQVEIDPYKLEQYHLSLSQVIEAIENNNASVGGSILNRGDLGYVVRGIGLIENLDDLGHIVVTTTSGVPVFLNDIGSLKYGNLERKGVLGYTDRTRDYSESLEGIVLLLKHENPSKVLDGIHAAVDELNPSYTDAWVRKGITLHNDKEYYEAEVCLNEAVRLSPALFKAIYNRGKNRLALDNIEGALGDFDRAVSLKPEHPKAHEYFGDALMRVGKEEEAALQWAIAERLREKNSKN